ncbi:MAG TPA: DUF4367 domain-containing protein [Chloroflexota bacterium]|nr:DUF4367 domain-containing protein [Chloroflexota bacterium]
MDEMDQEVHELLAYLEPKAEDAPYQTSRALAQVRQKIAATEKDTGAVRLPQFLAAPGRRYAAAGVLAALLLLLAFSFPTVRAAASEFLSLFRVQNFAAITISPEQIALLNKVAQEGLTPGKVEIMADPGQLTLVGSLKEAATRAGMASVQTIGELGEPTAVYVSSPGSGRLTIDLAGARGILDAVGADPLLLPDSLDGAQVNVAVFAGVDQQWQDVHFLQSPSPLVEYPEGLDTAVLGQALLQLLGLNEGEATRLSQEIDWTSTLLLPIPQDIASYQEVTVDGVSGMAVSELDGRAATLIWQKDGVIYTLFGNRSATELLALTKSLK